MSADVVDDKELERMSKVEDLGLRYRCQITGTHG
jgi:hypothetical protein